MLWHIYVVHCLIYMSHIHFWQKSPCHKFKWVMSQMNELFRWWMSHVTNEWFMSQMNESCCKWMSHVTCEWVMSRVNESCHMWMRHAANEWVMSHVKESCRKWMSHVANAWVMSHMNESCHIWMSHVLYEWVMSHMNESCLMWMRHVLYERVMSHMDEWFRLQSLRMDHTSKPPLLGISSTVTFSGISVPDTAVPKSPNAPVHSEYETWDMTHSWDMKNPNALVHSEYQTCDMTHSFHVRHDSFILRETWLIHIRHDSFTRDTTHSHEIWLNHLRHDSFICDMTHSFVTWLIHWRNSSFICNMTHWNFWRRDFWPKIQVHYFIFNIWMSHASFDFPHRKEFILYIWMSHASFNVPHSFCTYESVMRHLMSHIHFVYMDKSMTHLWLTHSFCIYGWVIDLSLTLTFIF